MRSNICPQDQHFHVVFERVGGILRPCRTVIASTPHEALEALIFYLPKGWRGGVSVYDDAAGHEDEMPILHAYVGNL